MLAHLPLRLRVLLIFAGLAGVAALVIGFALWAETRRLARQGIDPDLITSPLMLAGFIAILGVVLAVAGVWFLFDQNLARPLEHLAGSLRTGQPPSPDEARYLGDLGPAAQDAALARARGAEALAAEIAAHAAEQAREMAALESILSDFGAGAVMSDAHGRVVFYNAAAARMLPGLALDRPLERHLRAGALEAAAARLREGGVVATDLTAMTVGGVQLTGRMRPLDHGNLLILRDRPSDGPTPRAAIEALNRHAATLVPMLAALDGPIPPALARAIQIEGQGLANATRALAAAGAAPAPAARALLGELATGLDLADPPLPRLAVQAEAGPMNALLRLLDQHLRADGLIPRLRLATEDPTELHLALEWAGAALPMDRLEGWLTLPPDPDQPELSGADLLARHATGIWVERDDPDGARLVLPLARATAVDVSGGLTYDFGLSARGAASSRLADLTCVVFDTETTGLTESDRLLQIAGLRIAGGRLTGERFETLVQPGRPIPEASTRIHGITDAMVAAAPDKTSALTAFQHFTEGTTLVAHNAPFDMGFLRRAAPETGAHFDNRVLDTVLLSAMVWGLSADHSLDALCGRLGITIPPELRHTAMGDAAATAEAFLRLVPALAAKGLERFEDVQAEAVKYRRLISDVNSHQ